MTNMVPQAPDNNQGPWADLENDLRGLLDDPGGPYELYIVSGPLGIGGSGSGGAATSIANGHVTVPQFTWKVVLMLTKDVNDVNRVNPATRTIAVMMPNIQGIRNDDWHMYLTTVDAVESATGYDFFSNVSDSIESCIEAGIDGDNPPCTDDQSITTAEDTPAAIALSALSPQTSPSFTYTVGSPAHGTLIGTAPNLTYQPGPDFNGSDSFTFRVNDGHHESNVSTVNITISEVNDIPAPSTDSASTDEDTPLALTASSLTTNDSAGPSDESVQSLTVASVSPTANTHGSVSLNSGTINYSPDLNYNGPASFEYQVCDNGLSNGSPDPKCATGTVNITVNPVNDAPTLNAIGNQTVDLGNTLAFTASASDLDVPAQTLSFGLGGIVPAGATINSSTGVFSWTPTAAQAGHIYTIVVGVTDDGTPNLSDEKQIQVGVAYTWSGLQAPVVANGTYKVGRTIPIKFQLTGASAVVTTAQIHLMLFKFSNNVVGDEVDVQSTSAATTGNLFRYDASSNQYVFNLDTSGLTAGMYQLQIDMGDGVVRAVNISLR